MINLTRLTGAPFILNSDLISTIEATPDTVLSLTTDHKLVVKESPDEVVARIVAYKRSIYLNGPEAIANR
ncbi:MAG: flagellar FlbD family protein [Candidatus Sericytochromatia bacterium]|nr:flagellar FlbD family protein [Candidatus Sericytochromatia bacterium]